MIWSFFKHTSTWISSVQHGEGKHIMQLRIDQQTASSLMQTTVYSARLEDYSLVCQSVSSLKQAKAIIVLDTILTEIHISTPDSLKTVSSCD